MYSLVPYRSREARTVVPSIFPNLFEDFGMSRVFDRFNTPLNNLFNGSLMRNYATEDGSTVLEYNLAGYAPEEIKVRVDSTRNELLITATHNEDNNHRSFQTSVSLSPYTLPEDVTVDYSNGILKVSVAPIEKRKEESLTEIPVNILQITNKTDNTGTEK